MYCLPHAGGFFAVSSRALEENIMELIFSRCDTMEVFKKLPENSRPHIAIYRRDECKELVRAHWIADPSAAWIIDAGGALRRYSQGDSRHGESETRFVNAICQNEFGTSQSCDLNGEQLIISCDSDCPVITLLCDALQGRGVVHCISDYFLRIDDLHAALKHIQVSPQSVANAYIMGGCDFTPFTQHVPQKYYISALFRHRDILQNLSTQSKEPFTGLRESTVERDDGSLYAEAFVALAYFECGCVNGHGANLISGVPQPPEVLLSVQNNREYSDRDYAREKYAVVL